MHYHLKISTKKLCLFTYNQKNVFIHSLIRYTFLLQALKVEPCRDKKSHWKKDVNSYVESNHGYLI